MLMPSLYCNTMRLSIDARPLQIKCNQSLVSIVPLCHGIVHMKRGSVADRDDSGSLLTIPLSTYSHDFASGTNAPHLSLFYVFAPLL